MAYTSPLSRGEAALPRPRRSHKIFASGPGVPLAHDRRHRAGVVAVSVEKIEVSERRHFLDQRETHVRKSGRCSEMLSAASSREVAS
jgi:hypothetical protein